MKTTSINKVLTAVIFAAMCVGSMFASSRAFVSEHVTPKVYFAVFGGAALASYWTVLQLFRCGVPPLREMVVLLCSLVSAVCTAQAIYGLLQAAGFMPLHTFRLNSSFDSIY